MCDPITLVMAGMQVAGQVQQGRAANSAAQGQADELERQAAAERQMAERDAAMVRRAGGEARGRTLGALAVSGVKVGEGSALDVERQVMEDYSRDEYIQILNGEIRGRALEFEAGQTRSRGRDARRASYMQAGTSLLSAGYSGAKAGGWRSAGPGFSGTQAPAPVTPNRIPG
jgi:hypothetical protein